MVVPSGVGRRRIDDGIPLTKPGVVWCGGVGWDVCVGWYAGLAGVLGLAAVVEMVGVVVLGNELMVVGGR